MFAQAEDTPMAAKSKWRAGEFRPAFFIEAKPRYLRGLQKVSTTTLIACPVLALKKVAPPPVPQHLRKFGRS